MRRPPFSQSLATRLADRSTWHRWPGTSPDGRAVSIWIAAGGIHAWKWARTEAQNRLLLMAPVDRDPGELDWSLVAPHAPAVVLPFNAPASFIDRLAAAILRDGSEHVLVALDRGLIRYQRRVAA